MVLVNSSPSLGEQEQKIANTRAFAARKWTTTIHSLDLGWKDPSEVSSYESFDVLITELITRSRSSWESFNLQSLRLLAQPIGMFISTFKQLVEPEHVDVSMIWNLLCRNIQFATVSGIRSLHMNRWLGGLKRAIDSLNQAVDEFEDKSSALMRITDVFEPVLKSLTNRVTVAS